MLFRSHQKLIWTELFSKLAGSLCDCYPDVQIILQQDGWLTAAGRCMLAVYHCRKRLGSQNCQGMYGNIRAITPIFDLLTSSMDYGLKCVSGSVCICVWVCARVCAPANTSRRIVDLGFFYSTTPPTDCKLMLGVR